MTPDQDGERTDRECPHCGSNYDDVMDRPALEETGWNPKSGIIYTCWSCHDRITEAEIETGKALSELIESEFENFEPTPMGEYRAG